MILRCGSLLFSLALFACSAGTVDAPAAGKSELSNDASLCASEPQSQAVFLVGDWTTTLSTDEGWSGSGESSIFFDVARNCTIVERSVFSLDIGGGETVESNGLTVLSWDALSESWKLLSAESRGYTHMARASEHPSQNWAFEVINDDGDAPTRRVFYRFITENEFEWIWQGRMDDGSWGDRLVAHYKRVE